MHYTIEFDLDYDHYPDTELQEIWSMVRTSFLSAGFRADGRRFTIKRSPAQARALARHALDQVDNRLAGQGQSLYRYVRDFYGYPSTCVENLLVAPPDAIEVRNGIHHRKPPSEPSYV